MNGQDQRWQLTAGVLAILLILALVYLRKGDSGQQAPGQNPSSRANEPERSQRSLSALTQSATARAIAEIEEIAKSDAIITTDWKSLIEQPAIPLPGGGTAKIGLEARSASAGGGLLIYCLVEGGMEEMRTSSEPLGPFGTRVLNMDRPSQLELEMLHALSIPYAEGDRLLFTRAIPIPEQGEYRIELFLGEDRDSPIIGIPVTGTAEGAHPWFAFSPPAADVGAELPALGEESNSVSLVLDTLRPALPRHDGLAPVQRQDLAEPDLDSPLPGLIPETPDPGLQLRSTNSGFSLASDHPMETSRDGEKILARWWINGEPFSPPPDSEVELQEERLEELLQETNQLDVELDFDPSVLGAAPGDRIGLQLLHVPMGWSETGIDPFESRLQPLIDGSAPRGPRLSNRIEFVAGE